METQLLRSMRGLAAEQAKARFPEFTQNSLEIERDAETNALRATFAGPHNLLEETIEAVKTIKDDPGNHKKKALVGLGLTAAGAGTMALALRNPGLREAFKATAPSTLTGKILAAATPAAIYYMLQNMDRPERAALGAGVAAGTAGGKMLLTTPPAIAVPASAQGALVANSMGSLAMLHGYLMMSKNFQKASDIQKLKLIANDKNLSDEEKRIAIDMIVSRKDFLTRYPAFRHAPYAERLRSMYNKAHGYGTMPDRSTASLDTMRGTADTFIREKIRE